MRLTVGEPAPSVALHGRRAILTAQPPRRVLRALRGTGAGTIFKVRVIFEKLVFRPARAVRDVSLLDLL